MSFPESAIDDRLVTDAERAAFDVLPLLVAAGDALRSRYACKLADIIGNPGEFQLYVSGKAAERLTRMDRLLRVFRENVELLIHKTWVEKAEEKPKERLLEELAAFERDFRGGVVGPAFRRFVALSHAIASLLFGAQSRAPDFLVYCFRIDPKLGLFFWFMSELEKQVRAQREDDPSEDLMTTEVLIGVYVLSSF
jgi:hypothetical protein